MVTVTKQNDTYIVRAGTKIVAYCKSIGTAFTWADHYRVK